MLASSVELPAGFEQTVLVDQLHDPNAMEFAPDGRLFISERISGKLRIVKDGRLLGEPFVTVTVPPETPGGRAEAAEPNFRYRGIYHYGTYRSSGLRGIAFDPRFEQNGYIYLYYMNDAPRVNRVSRFTASRSNPDVAEEGSEKVLLDIPMHTRNTEGPVPDGGSHNGGGLIFGDDGKLYISVGDGWNPAPKDAPQDLSNLIGKVLRINPDGSVPEDNPFREHSGARSEIWAIGFRNPYTLSRHPDTGIIYVNDVVWGKETVYELVKGGNYRHPSNLGEGTPQSPFHTAHGLIAGGTWYTGQHFPKRYHDCYFLTDWRANVIRVIDPEENHGVTPFVSDSPRPTYIKQGPDGAIYWLSSDYETLHGTVYRIAWVGGAEEPSPLVESEVDLDPAERLLYHWPLDDQTGEIARDISGASAHGTLKEGVIWRHDHSSKGLVFDGLRGRIDLNHLDLPLDEFSIAAWIQPESFLPGMADNRIISKAIGTDEADHWWMLGFVRDNNAMRLRFRLKTRGQTSTLIARSGNIQTGRWSHVVASYDGKQMRLFHDGQAVGNLPKQGAPDRDEEVPTWLGDNPPEPGSRPFHGAIRDVRIYERALSADESHSLMMATSNSKPMGRAEIMEAYASALELEGEPDRGHSIFDERCVTCHQENGISGIGPDLSLSAQTEKAELFTSILDPNQDIPPSYWHYAVTTIDGEGFLGILTDETDTHLVIRMIDGQEQTLHRKDIQTFTRMEQSLMPEGLEAGLTPHDIADLIAYLRALPDAHSK